MEKYNCKGFLIKLVLTPEDLERFTKGITSASNLSIFFLFRWFPRSTCTGTGKYSQQTQHGAEDSDD